MSAVVLYFDIWASTVKEHFAELVKIYSKLQRRFRVQRSCRVGANFSVSGQDTVSPCGRAEPWRDLSLSSASCSHLASLQMMCFVRKGYGGATIGPAKPDVDSKSCAHTCMGLDRLYKNGVEAGVPQACRKWGAA